MQLHRNDRLVDIQQAFTNRYPYLKLEFYSGHHNTGEGSPLRNQLDHNRPISDFVGLLENQSFSIHPNKRIATLEAEIYDRFGINAQVFRRSGDLWLQTSATDSWTLGVANRKGENSVLFGTGVGAH